MYHMNVNMNWAKKKARQIIAFVLSQLAKTSIVLPCDDMAVGKHMINRAIVHLVKKTQTPKCG